MDLCPVYLNGTHGTVGRDSQIIDFENVSKGKKPAIFLP